MGARMVYKEPHKVITLIEKEVLLVDKKSSVFSWVSNATVLPQFWPYYATCLQVHNRITLNKIPPQ